MRRSSEVRRILKYQLLVWAVTICVVFPLVIPKCVYSPLFGLFASKSVASSAGASSLAKEMNRERFTNALTYIQSLQPQKNLRLHSEWLQGEHLEMMAVVVTTRRTLCVQDSYDFDCEPHYLQQTVAALDIESKHFHLKTQSTIPIVICNVDPEWKNHLDFIDIHHAFPAIFNGDKQESFETVRSKESADYAFCLNAVENLNGKFHFKSKPKYILVLEDDAVVFPAFFEHLFYFLKFRVKFQKFQGEWREGESWSYFKLFYPEVWMGFERNLHTLIELTVVMFFSAFFSYLLSRFLLKFKNFSSVLLCMSLGSSYGLFLALMIGRQTLLELRRISPYFYQVSHDFGCCTPAVLYPTEIIPQIVSYLQSSECSKCSKGVDLALDDFSKKENLVSHLVQPNLAHHIGMYSTLTTIKDPATMLFYDLLY